MIPVVDSRNQSLLTVLSNIVRGDKCVCVRSHILMHEIQQLLIAEGINANVDIGYGTHVQNKTKSPPIQSVI